MQAISQFYILSPRGDTIISRTYRNDFGSTSEVFFRNVKFWNGNAKNEGRDAAPGGLLAWRAGGFGDAPPCFNIDGVNYIYTKQNGIYFVCTSKYNLSPNFTLELLCRLAKLFKDYCGVLSEEAIRKNFIMVYELLDEILDYGLPQCTSTEQLKVHVHNEPVVVDSIKSAAVFKAPSLSQKTTPSSSVYKPVTLAGKGGDQRNEIFVDILERLTMLFNNEGYVLSASIEGCIQMKSYLAGNPPLRLALNEDLVVGKMDRCNAFGVVLDDCNFHECVRLDEFESQRTLNFVPPDGEFVLMNYRITSDFVAPFRVYPSLEEISSTQVMVTIRIRADLPQNNFGVNVVATLPVPSKTNGVSCKLESNTTGQSAEYRAKDHKVQWTIKKFTGGAEHTVRIKIDLKEPNSVAIRREIGPIVLQFEVPMFNTSNIQVKYLRIVEQNKTYNPHRWVRYVTQSSSYVCRI